MEAALYGEINVLCIGILMLVLHRTYKSVGLKINNQLFAGVLVNAILVFGLDFLWILIDSETLKAPRQVNVIVNAWYLALAGNTGFLWFLYSEHMITPSLLENKKKLYLHSIPMLVLMVISIASIWTGWLFYIDKNNIYHRGPFHIIQVIIGYGYMVWAACKAVYYAIKERNYIKRREYYTLGSFVIAPAICGGIQLLFLGIPALCVGITLSLLNIYMLFQEQQISVDPLTQLNNRNQLMRYLSYKMSVQNRKEKLFLIMMDLDYFKSINDTYGHVEGDNALLRVADTLRQVSSVVKCFVARYGGDEFILIYEGEIEGVMRLQQQIACLLLESDRKEEVEYKLTMSMGYAEYSSKFSSITQFIAAADEELYYVKKARKLRPIEEHK